MNIPQYLTNKKSVIVLQENIVHNLSKYVFADNKLILNSTDDVYLLLDDFKNSNIEIEFETNSDIQLFLIFVSSASANYNIKFNLHKNTKLNILAYLETTKLVNTSITRVFDNAENTSLILNNALFNAGKTTFNDLINLNGQNANVEINQLNIGSDNDLFIVNQDIKHKNLKTHSKIFNSMISNSLAKLKYSVSGYIFKGNEFSTCTQLNKGIILSEEGEIAVEPKLYIDEYNVEASHGAAIGQIDDEQLFYLLSRGLTENQARTLIISGYANPFVNLITDDDIKEIVEKQIVSKIKEVNFR